MALSSEERFLGLRVPGKAERRSPYLKVARAEFLAGEGHPQHYSPSGMTAIYYAEAALEAGRTVTLRIHPLHGVILSLDDDSGFPDYEEPSHG